jgi:E3 SUMO-protein ligase PIAS1
MSTSLASEVATLTAFIKPLTNPQLKDLLRYEGLQVSGLKATLQFRIIQRSSSLPNSPQLLLFLVHSITCLFYNLFFKSLLQPILADICILTNEIGIQSLAESDPVSFDALARRIRATAFPNTAQYSSSRPQYQPSPVSQSPAQTRPAPLGVSMPPHQYSSGPSAPLMNPPTAAHKSSGPLIFKESPFYTILEPLTPIVECKSMLRMYL